MSGYDDNQPLRLSGPGWEEQPDGSFVFLVDCATLLDYTLLPRELLIGGKCFCKAGWNSDRKLAAYRDNMPEVLEAMKVLL